MAGTKLKVTAGKGGGVSPLGAKSLASPQSKPNPLTPKKKDYSKSKKGSKDTQDFGIGNFGMTGMTGED
jgi:hypothetical protein